MGRGQTASPSISSKDPRLAVANARAAAQTHAAKISDLGPGGQRHICQIEWGFEHLPGSGENLAMQAARTGIEKLQPWTSGRSRQVRQGSTDAVNFQRTVTRETVTRSARAAESIGCGTGGERRIQCQTADHFFGSVAAIYARN